MATPTNIFDTEEDQNWFKACLATRWTREGTQGVIATGAERLHKQILDDVWSTNSVPAGTTCNQCSTASLGVLPCPTRGVCKKLKGKCQFHTVQVTICPNKICDALREKIKSEHRFKKPSWKNTRAERWCREPFELIKCFLPEDGYLDVGDLESTDFNGIVSILINCKWFTPIITEDITTDDNVCTKARVVARDLRHNSRFQLDTTQLQDLMAAFLKLLQALVPDPGAKIAFDKVTKLQVEGVTISAIDINGLIKDIRESIKGTVEDAIEKTSETQTIKIKLDRDEATKHAEDMINRLMCIKNEMNQFGENTVKTVRQECRTQEENFRRDVHEIKEGLVKDAEEVQMNAKEEMNAFKETVVKGLGREVLEDIRDESATAGRDITHQSREVLTNIKGLGREVLEDIRDESATAGRDITHQSRDVLTNIKGLGREVLEDIRDESATAGRDITHQSRDVLTNIKGLGREVLKDIRDEAATAGRDITHQSREVLTNIKDLEGNRSTREHKIYEQKKIEFRQGLITYYTKKKCFAQVSPLNPKHKAPLEDLYVPPKLLCIQKEEGTSCRQSSNGPLVKTYRDIFFNEGQKLENIYIQGEAGSGKSTFCSNLTSAWCKTHSTCKISEGTHTEIYFSDCGVLKSFDFLFLVILRIANKTDTDIRALIQKQIADQLRNENPYTEEFVRRILDRENCLVVVDGLDEWPHSIPERISRPNCTFLTTTRPWKMTEVQLLNTEVDKEILIDGVVDTELLVSNVLACLNQSKTKPKQTTKEISYKVFIEKIRDRDLCHLLDVPIVTTQLVCIWFVTGTLGKSRCDVYARMFEMLLKRSQADKKTKATTTTSDPNKLPACFSERHTPICTTNRDFIAKISKLAYTTLVSEDRNASIVFDQDIVSDHLSDSECRLALETGLLSEYEVESVIEERSSFNFLHKTFQEFLCAMYIASYEGDGVTSCLKKLTCAYKNVLDMKLIFTFTCGLNKYTGECLSAQISNLFKPKFSRSSEWLIHYDDIKYYQEIIVAGYSECNVNGHAAPQLTFLHAFIASILLTAREMTVMNRLLNVNAGKLLTLSVSIQDVETIQKVVDRNPGLRHISLEFIGHMPYGCTPYCVIDLSKCAAIETLLLYAVKINIKLPTNLCSTLETCWLLRLEESVERTMLTALTTGAPKLRKLYIAFCEHPGDLLQLLPALSSLQVLDLSNTEIGDKDLNLPPSIRIVKLFGVYMSERSFKKLVNTMTQMPQTVQCSIRFDKTQEHVFDRSLKYVAEHDMCNVSSSRSDCEINLTSTTRQTNSD